MEGRINAAKTKIRTAERITETTTTRCLSYIHDNRRYKQEEYH
jgi:hypothetical protein